MTRVHLGEFEQILLLALARLDEDASSLDVRGCIEARTGRAVSPGAIYTAFQRLERRGFVATSFGEPTPSAAASARSSIACAPPASARCRRCRLRSAGSRAGSNHGRFHDDHAATPAAAASPARACTASRRDARDRARRPRRGVRARDRRRHRSASGAPPLLAPGVRVDRLTLARRVGGACRVNG